MPNRLHTMEVKYRGLNCQAAGCQKERFTMGPYCLSCRRRRVRHGECHQPTVSKHDLTPHIQDVKWWLEDRDDRHGWTPLRNLWEGFETMCRSHYAGMINGRPGNKFERKALGSIVKVFDEASADTAILTLAAYFRLREVDGRKFVSDDGFRVSMARQFRRLASAHVGVSIDPTTYLTKKVYKDYPRAASLHLGTTISKHLGGAFLMVSKTMSDEELRDRFMKAEAMRQLSIPSEYEAT